MPVSEEDLKAMVSAINLSSWDARAIYSGLPHADLSDDQKATLKKPMICVNFTVMQYWRTYLMT